MNIALNEAKKGLKIGEVPIGAVMGSDLEINRCLFWSHLNKVPKNIKLQVAGMLKGLLAEGWKKQ